MSTQLMCIEQTDLAVCDSADLSLDEDLEQDVDQDENVLEQFEDVQGDVDMLEAELKFVNERVQDTMTRLSADSKDIEGQILRYKHILASLQSEFETSDDFEEQESAKDIEAARRKMFPDDFDDEQSDVAYDENEMSDAEKAQMETVLDIRLQCKRVFKKIANQTHPDKAKKKSERTRQTYNQIFLDAKAAYEDGDLDELVRLHEKLFGVETKQVNLMQRLIAALQRREELRYAIAEIKQSGPWGMHQVEMEYGYETALTAYRSALTNTLDMLKQLIEEESDN